MKRTSLLLVCAICATASAQGPVNDHNPGSLFVQGQVNPLLDRTAQRPGDLLTILIGEFSNSSFSAATSASKSESNRVNASLGPILSRLIPELGTSASSSMAGQGATSQSGRFVARMTVKVVEVLPNGNLIIEGRRWIQVNKELQSFKLTGIVRRDDVRSDNTILSEQIADAEIIAEGKGTIADRQRRGVITRLLDWLF
jgi:flagellar L-ring protein FlgH